MDYIQVPLKFKQIYGNVAFRFVENCLNCLESVLDDAHVIDSDSNSEHSGEYNHFHDSANNVAIEDQALTMPKICILL